MRRASQTDAYATRSVRAASAIGAAATQDARRDAAARSCGATVIECTLTSHSSGMSGSGGREVGAVVEEMKDEDPVAAEKLVDWLAECEKAKGKEVLKSSITKVEAGGRTGMHGDADYDASCRDVLTILSNPSAALPEA